VVQTLRADPRVAYIEQDQIAQAVTTQPNPPSWGLDRIDQHAQPLSGSYDYDEDGTGVDAYILDTGILTTHAEFGGRAVAGYDAITPDGTAADGNGHGTHVAGTVGGATYGVAKGVHLIAVRVLDDAGFGSYAAVIAGVDWVTADHTDHPAVANMSLGGPPSAALDDAVRRSIADGVTYAVAAGNSSADVATRSPADVAEAIVVGATDVNDGFASISNFGAGVDVLAPGVDITSSWNTSTTATNTLSGTSMAAPHVAGAAALYLEAHPAAAPAEVESALTGGATSGLISGLPAGTPNRLLYSLAGQPPPPPPAPAVPVLASPTSGATGILVPVALSWVSSPGATSYRVQLSASSAFVTMAYDQLVTATAATVAGLSGGTVYYWRVNAGNGNGTSDWSPASSFTTVIPAPAAATLRGPANGATGVVLPPTLSWNASPGAATYRVQVSGSGDFATRVFDRSVATTSASATGLARGTGYYWRVRASNAGGASAWSATRKFTTLVAAPATPTLRAPANGATGVAVPATLSWNAASRATAYRIQVSRSSTFGTLFLSHSGLTTTSASIPGLSARALYYWRVRASNAGGNSSWSSVRRFTTR
jgi:subtilisin family serine protease